MHSCSLAAPLLTYPLPEHALASIERYSQIPRLLGQALDRFREDSRQGAPRWRRSSPARSTHSTGISTPTSSTTHSLQHLFPKTGMDVTHG